ALVPCSSTSARVDLIESAAVGEGGPVGLRPSPETLVDGEEGHLRERGGVLRRDGGEARAEEVLGGDLLTLGSVEEVEIGLRDDLRVVLGGVAFDDGDGRLGGDRDGRADALEVVLRVFL